MAETDTNLLNVKLSGKFAVGERNSRHARVINDIDWNRHPNYCPCFHTDTMLATGSEVGTGIFGLLPGTPEQLRWMGLEDKRFKKLYQSPVLDGETTALKFHQTDGRILATGSEFGVVTILVYDANAMNFVVANTFEGEPNRISSISWHSSGKYLICSSASQIFFLRLLLVEDGEIDPPSFNLELLGSAQVPNCPTNTRISALCHPTYPYMYSGADYAEEIKIWSLKEADESIWRPKSSVGCLAGFISMSMNFLGDVLTTLHVGDEIQQWIVDTTTAPGLTAGRRLTRNHYNMRYGNIRTNSSASALDSSRWGRMASAGKDNAGTCNTLLVHQQKSVIGWEVAFKQSRRPVTVEDINCLKFNPDNDCDKDFAIGGSGGFVYLWAVAAWDFNLGRTIDHDGDEEYYYMGSTNKRTQKKMDKYIPEDIDEARYEEWKEEDLPNRRPFLFDDFNGFMHEIVYGPDVLSDDFAAETDGTSTAHSSPNKQDETDVDAFPSETGGGSLAGKTPLAGVSPNKQDEAVVDGQDEALVDDDGRFNLSIDKEDDTGRVGAIFVGLFFTQCHANLRGWGYIFIGC